MRELWLYDAVTRLGLLNYRTKIMTVAFVGTHIPLIALVGFVALKASSDWPSFLATLGIALVATLFGTGITLLVLDHLLRPVLMTARALRTYREERVVCALPTHYTDEVGTLMADATHTLTHLEHALDILEYTDTRTGLPNRKRLVRDVEHRLAGDGAFTVYAIHFANYDRLLDTLDLAAAEIAAAEIAGRLKTAAPVQMPLYRAGAAQFMLLADDVNAPSACTVVLNALIAACSQPLQAGAVTIEPILKAGVAFAPGDADQPDTLIDHALAAAAQTRDVSHVRFHSPVARAAAIQQLNLEQEIRRALAHDEFVLHYQPVVDLANRHATGAEALIRWQHPVRGLLDPGQFIGVAEATGLIDPIGLWVLRKACMQLRSWKLAGHTRTVAVNLSARQFLDPDLITHVREALDAAQLSPDQLEIELTETAAMAHHDHTRAVFGKLRDLGVGIAIDDFGTGFASMSYLRKLPFDKLKIDREFVSDVQARRESQAICGALLTLAEGLAMRVLAEGTETADEVTFLTERGCALYQGFYFARPLAPDAFEAGVQQATLKATALVLQRMDALKTGNAKLSVAVRT